MALPSVFISYAHEDRSLAEVIAAGLSHRGCGVWIDEGELRAGDSVIDRIAEGVEHTDFLVGLVSEASVHSDWCRRELSLALTGELSGIAFLRWSRCGSVRSGCRQRCATSTTCVWIQTAPKTSYSVSTKTFCLTIATAPH